MKFIAPTILGFAVAAHTAAAGSLYDFFFTSQDFPPSLSKTVKVAEKEKDRIDALLKEVSGSALFLPTNQAWALKPGVLDAVLAEPEGNVRYDMLLASSAAIPANAGASFESLLAFAEGQGGVVDSAYGTPYFVKEGGRICLAEWASGNYVEGDCASVVGSPIRLADATIYQIDKVIVSSDLEDNLDVLLQRRLRM